MEAEKVVSVSGLFFDRLGCNLNDISLDVSIYSPVQANANDIRETANQNNMQHENYAAFQIKFLKFVQIRQKYNSSATGHIY